MTFGFCPWLNQIPSPGSSSLSRELLPRPGVCSLEEGGHGENDICPELEVGEGMSPEGIQGKGVPEIQNSKFIESEAEEYPAWWQMCQERGI